VRGLENRIESSYIAPRGLSASASTFVFAASDHSIVLDEIGKIPEVLEIPAVHVITAITNNLIAVLCQDGRVFLLNENRLFVEVSIPIGLLRIAPSFQSFIGISTRNTIFVISGRSATEYFPPPRETIVNAVHVSGQVIALSSNGVISSNPADSRELTTDYSAGLAIPRLSPFAAIVYGETSVVFVRGPRLSLARLPSFCPVSPLCVCCTDSIAYLRSATVKLDEFRALILSNPAENLGVTATGRIVALAETPDGDFDSFGLCCGDELEVAGVGPVTVVGFADGAVWLRYAHSGFVSAVAPTAFDLFAARITDFRRFVDGSNVIQKVTADGANRWVDVFPGHCRKFGYEPGDLIWQDPQGIVEVLGVTADRLVCLDLATRLPFLLDPLKYKVMRRATEAIRGTRKVLTTESKVVNVNIASDGPRIFVATDRVNSPMGEATVVGFAGRPYIQTDEMRVNGQEAVGADIFDLSLIRRIRRPAEKTVKVGDQLVKVSLNTEDGLGNLMPGDRIRVLRRYARIVGFTEEKCVIQAYGGSECEFLEGPCEIIYRADISARRSSVAAPFADVGSPILQESRLFPGDIVVVPELGKCEFLGCGARNTLFVSTLSGELWTLGFSMLLLPDFFEVEYRPALAKIEQ
jgi:hypothetical protein